MSKQKLAAFFLAVVMAFMALPAKASDYRVALIWQHEWVFVHDPDDRYSGYYDVEYDDGGNPFYRFVDAIIPVDPESVESAYEVVYITIPYSFLTVEEGDDDFTIVDFCLLGNEFHAKDNRYFAYEVAGWSTEPDGEVEIESNQPFSRATGEFISRLKQSLTLYPVVWRRLPNITYHDTYTGKTYESKGGYMEHAASNFDNSSGQPGGFFERPYYYQTGWAEEPGGAIRYHFREELTKSEHMDLYSVWEQSRISDIPPVNKLYESIEHFTFGGRYWRKIGCSQDKVLLISDERMRLDNFIPEYLTARELYEGVSDCCTDWYNSFSDAEKAAVSDTYKAEDPESAMSLQGAKLFLLSRLEAYTYFAGKEDRKFYGMKTNRWLLRNWLKDLWHEDHAIPLVDANGGWGVLADEINFSEYINEFGLDWSAGERPVFVLDLTKVLFTSSNSGSKSSAPTDGSSFGQFSGSYDPYEGNLWRLQQKVTLPDETYKDFAAHVNDSDRAVVTPGGTLEVSYVNAVIDTESVKNRYISAMLCDSAGEVVGYASMKPSASSGTWELILPQNLASGVEYTLKVFNEQQNGSGSSDYASPFSVISLLVYLPLDGEGTEDVPWLIKSAADWNLLCSLVNGGKMTSGAFYRLTEDISVTEMLGTAVHPFSGTFDGAGYTLSFNSDNHPERTAPFRYISSATIRDLHVTGRITGTNRRASALIGENSGSSKVTNCRVSAEISGSRLIGGFCIGTGNAEDTLTITGSVFDGKITGNPDQSGCFVAWGTSGLSIADSVAAPQSESNFSGGMFFYTGSGGTGDLTNSYYTQAIATVQGKQAHSVTTDEGVTADYGMLAKTHNVSGIAAYPTGLRYGNTFYAGEGDVIPLGLFCSVPVDYLLAGYDASAGSIARNGESWTLTMPNENVLISAVFTSAFETPDFTLPAAITTVEEEAFLSAGMSVVLVPDSCTSISNHAFKDCAALTQIHIPAACTLGTDVFDGCTLVYVFGTSGSPAETYCQEHENCVFVKE